MSDDLLERMTKALREEGGAEPSPERSVMVRARVLAQTKRRAQLRPQGVWQWAAVICLGFFVSTAMAQVIRVQLPRMIEALRPAPAVQPPAAVKKSHAVKAKPASPVVPAAPSSAPEPAAPEPVAPAVVPGTRAEAPAPIAPAVPTRPRAAKPTRRVPVEAPPPVEEHITAREPEEVEPAQPTEPPPSAAPVKVPAPESAELALFRRAQALHLKHDPRAIEAWDAYLRVAPGSALAPEARYNRALGLVRASRFAEAKRALAPFAEGQYGAYRREEAQALLVRLPK
jgi:hypothetical protein